MGDFSISSMIVDLDFPVIPELMKLSILAHLILTKFLMYIDFFYNALIIK